MISLRRADQRHHDRCENQDVWLTFSSQQSSDGWDGGFGSLESLNEVSLGPGARLANRSHPDAEVVTYVCEGGLSVDDLEGRRGIIQAGEYRRMNARRTVRTTEMNASRSASVHFFQICLAPSRADLAPSYEQKRFGTGERRGGLRVIASPDARNGSLLVHQQAVILSALLDPGQHVVHELAADRSAWLHLVRGEASIGDLSMTTGDGAAVVGERCVSFTAHDAVEVLLIDLATAPLESRRTGPGGP
jgi:redox-sensitive bicupin YhaK (pirin superfamily)